MSVSEKVGSDGGGVCDDSSNMPYRMFSMASL